MKKYILSTVCLLGIGMVYGGGIMTLGAPKDLGIDEQGNFYKKAPERQRSAAPYFNPLWAQRLYPSDDALNGQGVKIAIVDSGISPHSEFNGKNIAGQDFTMSGGIADLKDHGTCIAGIIGARGERFRGVAPGASLVVYKVDDGSTLIAPQAVTAAVNTILDYNEKNPADKISIINLSYGVLSGGFEPLSNALRRAYNAGVVVVAPSGNVPFEGVAYPAKLSEVIAVSALNADTSSAYANSSYGAEVDFIAPGDRVYTTSADGGYMYMSGTSIATAFVSGSAAIAVQGLRAQLKREPTVDEVKESLQKACIKLTEIPASKQGRGFIDVSRLRSQFK